MNSKALRRIGAISANTLRQIIVSLCNIAVPFLVLHFAAKDVWGSFVELMLFSFLALQFISFGSKEFQLRQFSQSPGSIAKNYSGVLTTRWIWVLVFACAAFVYFPIWQGIFIIIWIIGRFLALSAESLIIYEKAFSVAIVIEVGTFIAFCLGFWLPDAIDAQNLLVIYSVYQLAKGVCFTGYFRKFLVRKHLKWQHGFHAKAFPFFLLSILGFLGSKIDVYLMALMKDKIATADYQIINSLLVFIMSSSALVYAPFTKNIYRNNDAVVAKTRKMLIASGLFIVPVSLVAVSIIVKIYLGLSFGIWFYLAAFLYVFPAFAYGIDGINLFRQNRETTVLAYLFVGVLVNTVLTAVMINFGYGIEGALTGSAVAQLLLLVLFKLPGK